MFFEESLRKKLEVYYDLEDNFSIAENHFDFIARYNQRNSKYVLKKNIEIYSFEYNEYIFYKKLDKAFSQENLNQINTLLAKHYDQIINVNDEHMCSSIIFVFETELPEDKELVKAIEKFRFYKSFKFGFNGWFNGGIVLINPKVKKGLSNKYAKKELKKFLV